jgi:hypothetical protein
MKGRRDLVFAPYIAVDQVNENTAEICRIYHGAGLAVEFSPPRHFVRRNSLKGMPRLSSEFPVPGFSS